MKVKEESKNVGLKLNIQKIKIMASSPIASWQIDGETMETETDFIFLGSKITADSDCSREIKKTLAPWKKSYEKPRQHIKKQRHYFTNKSLSVKAMVFPVVMYGCESWTIKKAECQRIDAFELWCWRRLLRVSWTARRYKKSILKEISPEYSLEGLMLKLKLQYFGHLMRRPDSLEKTLMLGGIGGKRKGEDRGWDGWMASPTRWTWIWVNSGVGDGQESLMCCSSWSHKELDRSDWTELSKYPVGRINSMSVKHYVSVSLFSLEIDFTLKNFQVQMFKRDCLY